MTIGSYEASLNPEEINKDFQVKIKKKLIFFNNTESNERKFH